MWLEGPGLAPLGHMKLVNMPQIAPLHAQCITLHWHSSLHALQLSTRSRIVVNARV